MDENEEIVKETEKKEPEHTLFSNSYQKIITFLNIMSLEFPLSDLSEKIESETDGIFSFKSLYKIISKTYKKLSKKEKKNFIKYLPISLLKINPQNPYILLSSLFNYFGNILNIKINSPSLLLYEISNKLKNLYKKSTLEFFITNGFEASNYITKEEFIKLFYKNLNLGQNELNILFEMINYNKREKIKIENIILSIDSFRDDNHIDTLNEEEKKFYYFNNLLGKVFIDIEKIFKKEKKDHININSLKILLKEKINKNIAIDNDEYISDNLMEIVFSFISKNDNIYIHDYKEILNEINNKLKYRKMKLTFTQKFWINKFVEKLLSKNIEPINIFKDQKVIEMNDINELLLKINLKKDENNDVINSFDINHNGIINFSQYKVIIDTILKERKDFNDLNIANNNIIINDDKKIVINNLYECGLRPDDYYLLPLKGNSNILNKLNKKIKETKFSKNKIYNINDDNNNNKNILEDKSYKCNYGDEFYLKSALENFNFNKNKFTCFELMNYLIKNDFNNKFCLEVVKHLDKDSDGYIDVIDLFKFLLNELKYKSTKLVYKYLYIRIYKELNLKKCQLFFKMYNLDINQIINNDKFIKVMKDLNIDFPLTKQILYDLKIIYEGPLIYKYVSDQIDYYKNDNYINDIHLRPEITTNYSNYSLTNFEQEIKSNINTFTSNGISIKNKLFKILSKCEDNLSYLDYIKKIANPLNFNEFFSLIIFQLLKTFSKNGEQIISKNDLLIFFESYSFSNINSSLTKKGKKQNIKEIIKSIEKKGAPLNYSLDKIPFRKSGLISSVELIKYLCEFYNGSIEKSELMNIVFFLDNKKIGIISYEQIQSFINLYLNKFSFKLELQIIVCNMYKYNYINAENYFQQNKFNKIINNDFNININKNEHNILLDKMCSNDINKSNIFTYLANSQNKNQYNLQKLIYLLNYYFTLDIDLDTILNNEMHIEDALPDKKMIEKILKEINLGTNGNLSLNEFIMKFDKKYRKKLIDKIDINKEGFISYPKFIEIIKNIYGSDIDLNYKLCAQYIFMKYIKSKDKIKNYLLKKAGANFLNIFLTHKKAYKIFLYDFCNNKILFETFFMKYKEKKGKNINKLNLISFEQFILINNNIIENDEKNNIISLNNILQKKNIKMKDIINLINVEQSGLDKNFIIKEIYIKNILQSKLNLINKDIELICKMFNSEENKFNLKKLFEYENIDIKNYDIILNKEILPKIRNKIEKGEIMTYKEYKKKFFNNIEYLDICELYYKFNNLYNIPLYNCLLIMKGEYFFSIEEFFAKNNLKSEFKLKETDPSLKLALIILNDYFKKNTDKIKIFKEFDLDRNGKLSNEEFITALNSFENLSLNDSQKYKILNFIDINKDGIIDLQEFIKFINNLKNSINEKNELNINSTLFKKKLNLIQISEGDIMIDKNQIKNNINYNKNSLKNNRNTFLNYIIILQEDLLKNDNDSIEKQFKKEDPINKGIININKFKSILKKKLLNIKKEIFEKFVMLANKGIKGENNNENENIKINYPNFLINISKFRFNDINDKDNLKIIDDSQLILPKIF